MMKLLTTLIVTAMLVTAANAKPHHHHRQHHHPCMAGGYDMGGSIGCDDISRFWVRGEQ